MSGGAKQKWNDTPALGVYRVLCAVSLQQSVELVSEAVAELPAGNSSLSTGASSQIIIRVSLRITGLSCCAVLT